MASHVSEGNINEYGRFDSLKRTADSQRAKAFFERREGRPIAPFKVSIMIDRLLREFVLTGGFDLD
jgi:type I restriction enzyme R subunit